MALLLYANVVGLSPKRKAPDNILWWGAWGTGDEASPAARPIRGYSASSVSKTVLEWAVQNVAYGMGSVGGKYPPLGSVTAFPPEI